MIACAIYPRKSKAVDNSDSMDAQIDMCVRYLDDKYGKKNYSVKIYDGDYGITGHSIKQRKDFQRMMKDISDKKIQLVLIQRYDRIARNTRDFCNLYHDMEMNGCNLVSVSQQIDTTTPYGKKFMYDQASMAELEWALCSERRKDANRYARSIGKCTLPDRCITTGYKAEYIDGIRRLVIDREKEPIVREIFAHYDKYHNYCATAKLVNDKYGLSYSNGMIKRMMNNRMYIGEYRENKNYCEPYFTLEEWEKFQQKRPVIRNDCTKKSEILFSGMIRCPVCGRKMRAQSKKHKSGRTSRYYHCEYHSTRICEFNKIKSELLLEKMLLDNMDNLIKKAFDTVLMSEEEKKTDSKNSGKYKAELDRLNTMFLKGRINEDFYDTEYLRLTKLIEECEPNKEQKGNMEIVKSTFVGNWQEAYMELDKLHKKLFWRELIKEIQVDADMNIVGLIFN